MAASYRYTQLSDRIADVSTAETLYIPVTAGSEGKVTQVKTALGGAISGADSKVVVSVNSTVLGTIVIANTSSAAGDIDTLDVSSPTAGYVKAGDYIKVACGGESTDTASAGVTIDILR